jgi:hypothetical protein
MKALIFAAAMFAALFATSPSRAVTYDYTFTFTATQLDFDAQSFALNNPIPVTGTITGITAGTTTNLAGDYFNITSITSPFGGQLASFNSAITSYLLGSGNFLTTDINGNVLAGSVVGTSASGAEAGVLVNNSAAIFLGSPTIIEIVGVNPTFSAQPGTPAVTPLPGSVWMFGSALALGGLVTMMRRRSAPSITLG